MKRLMVTVVLALAAALAFAAEEAPKRGETPRLQAEKPKLTPEQKQELRKLRALKRFGGYIEKRDPDSGKFLFVDAQKRVGDEYKKQLEIISDIFALEVVRKVTDRKVGTDNAVAVIKELGGAAGVVILDDPSYPTLLVAPEAGWGFVNVAALAADNPGQALLEKRVRREVWRAFAMVAGSPDTEWKQCLLAPITSLRDLDLIDAEAVSPEPMSKIARHLPKLGIKPFYRVTYRQACEEGWAPQPTNEYQKAVWDKVHDAKERGPENALKIPMPGKGK